VTEISLVSKRRNHIAIAAVCFAAALLVLRYFAPSTGEKAVMRDQDSIIRAPIIDQRYGDPVEEESQDVDIITEPSRSGANESNDDLLDSMVRRAQPHSSKYERFEAIADLGDTRTWIAEQTLASLLNDQDTEIREAAVEALGAHASPGAISGLSYALRDPDELVRRSAIEYLADIGTNDALEALTITLDDQNTDLRLSVVTELADLRSAPAAALLQRFLSDSDPLIREIAADSLNESLE
jgi:HEAT repeat protein